MFEPLLSRLGVRRGDRVALITNNRIEAAIVVFASQSLGAATVAMYESQLDEDWRFILADCGAKACFVDSHAIWTRVSKLSLNLPDLQHLVNFDEKEQEGASFALLMEEAAQDPVASIVPADADLAYIFYTSGTTGTPKGVELTHFSCAANTSAILDLVPIGKEDRSLAFLPWAHVFGGTTEINTLVAVGASMAICESTDKIVEYLAEVKPTMLVSVPRIWNRIYGGLQQQIAAKPGIIQAIFFNGMSAKSKLKEGQALTFKEKLCLPLAQELIFRKVVKKFGGNLKYAFSAAAALSREVGEFIDNLGITVYEAYGLTETSSGVCGNSPKARRLGSVGKPIAGVEAKLDQSLGTEEGEGEIIVYGTCVMAGYHNRPDLTAEVMTEDGGFRTGDLGRFDEEGFLFITGRIKELYKLSNGKYVAPAYLEEKLALSPYIAQIMIHGADHPYNVAVIVPDFEVLKHWAEVAGLDTTEDALIEAPEVKQLFSEELAKFGTGFKKYDQLQKFILVCEEFSVDNDMLTPTMKVKRRNVVKNYGAQLEALYNPEGCP